MREIAIHGAPLRKRFQKERRGVGVHSVSTCTQKNKERSKHCPSLNVRSANQLGQRDADDSFATANCTAIRVVTK